MSETMVGRAVRVGKAAGFVFGFMAFACGCSALAQAAAAPSKPAEASYDAKADPRAVVTEGHARFTVLTPQMVRMEWSADGKFEDRPSFVFVNRRLPVPSFHAAHNGSALQLRTDALDIAYNPAASPEGKFTPESLRITLTVDGREVVWKPGTPDPENLMGTTRTLDGALGDKTREPIEQGLLSRSGWAVVDDSTRPLFDSSDFSFRAGEKSAWPWVVLRSPGDRQDWYFLGYGHDYRQALADYVRVAGRIPLPPQFAFGMSWSRYWAYSDQELDDLVRGFHNNSLPLDVLVIDMDWHLNKIQLTERGEKDQSGHNLGWSGYTWNPLLFPDPKDFLTNLHHEGLKVTMNLHPASGVQPWEDAYPAMARAMGIDPATRKYVPFDITSKKFAENYMDLLHHPLEHQGVDFWWLDWQQEMHTSTPGVNPTWWLNYVHFTDQEREGKRPLLFHRWGGLGNHRYQIGFSGDTVSVWPSLAFQPWFTATAANVGYAYWSHDIGGHMPGSPDPELYTRWIQFGVYSPILRTHTTKNPDAERRVWAYPEPYSSIMRDMLRERYAMQPYLYTEGRRTYDTGVAFLHPLYYDWPEADAAYTHRDEYVFGSQMIVAPVVAPVDATTHLASERVWIPKGEWIETASGKHFTGPRDVERSFAIDQVPTYVPAGAIIPREPAMLYTGEKPVDPLIVRVYPLHDGQSSSYKLYADGSQSESYKTGAATWTTIAAKQSGDTTTIEIAPVKGSYPGMITSRAYRLELPADWPPSAVTVNGHPLTLLAKWESKPGWRFDGNTLTTMVSTARFPVGTPVKIEVRRFHGALASRSTLDGFAGSIARLRGAYDAINAMHPAAWSPNVLIDAMQTGDRLSYHPQTAQQELARFPQLYAKSIAEVHVLETTPLNVGKVSAESDADRRKREAATRRNLSQAVAMLSDGDPRH